MYFTLVLYSQCKVYYYTPSNSFSTTAHVWNFAVKQGRVSTAPEVSKLTAEMIAGSNEGSGIDPFSDRDEHEDQTEKN